MRPFALVSRRAKRLSDTVRRLLSVEMAQKKCHLGEGHPCCSFLVSSNQGFECGLLITELATAIMERLAKGTINARGDVCSDPMDDMSESVRPATYA